MSGCAGRLRNFFRRGKSLPPPGGTQAGTKNAKDKKNKNTNLKHSSSLPSIDILPDSVAVKTNGTSELGRIVSEQKNSKGYKNQPDTNLKHSTSLPSINVIPPEDNFEEDFNQNEEDEDLETFKQIDDKQHQNEEAINETLIFPAPLSFRSSDDDEDEEEDEDSETSHQVNTSVVKSKDKDMQFLTSLNKSLEQELLESSKSSFQSKHQRAEEILNLNSIIKSPILSSNKSPKSKSKLRHTQLRFEKSLDTTVSSQNKSFQNNQSFFVDQDISEMSHTSNRNEAIATNTIQKLFETYSVDKVQMEKLKTENGNLRQIIEQNRQDALERETKSKQENDRMVERVQHLLTKEARNEAEKEALKNYFHSKQQDTNDNLILEQKKMIDNLHNKCQDYEKELKKSARHENDVSQINFDELKEEIDALKNIIYHLNIELSSYQAKYPSPSLLSHDKSEFSGLEKQDSIPIWLVNSKYLSPLIAAYDERITEKDEKLKLLRRKIDDLTNKFKMILDENNQLHSKLEKMPFSGIKSEDAEELNELNKIRHHARLVLEENQVLKEQLEMQQTNLLTIQKNQIQEIGNLSKRIIINETDKTDLKNQIQTLKTNNDELLRKYNDTLSESQRRISLQEFLSQTGELKRKIDESNQFHKQELEGVTNILKNLQEANKELNIKYTNLNNENKKLSAENKVLDQALNEGIGRKTQKKIQDLQKRLELAEMKEQTAVNMLEKITQKYEKIHFEKEAYQNLAKNNEIEIKKFENKLSEEDLKVSKLEDKLLGYKDKSAAKLASIMQQLKKKDSDFSLYKAETDKKISDVLNLLQKKQDQIEDLIREKRQMEIEVEFIWQSTTNENRKLKEAFLDHKIERPNHLTRSSHHTKLLLDDII